MKYLSSKQDQYLYSVLVLKAKRNIDLVRIELELAQ